MRECNECVKRSCRIIEDYRRGKLRMTPEDMQQSCPMVQKERRWGQPLIRSAMIRNAQGVYDVLQKFDMYIRESADKPFFRILLKEIQ